MIPRRRFSRSATHCNALSSRSPHAPSVTRGQRGLAAPSAAATDVVVLCCSAATSLLLHVAYKPFPGRLHSRGEYVLYECDASRRGMAEAQLKLAGDKVSVRQAKNRRYGRFGNEGCRRARARIAWCSAAQGHCVASSAARTT